MRVVFVGRDRKVPKRLVFYLLTFGISRRIWLHRINKELDGHDALQLNHTLNKLLLILPIIGPTIVTKQTAQRVRRMVDDSPVAYGPPWLLWLATWIPILGNLFFIGWTQHQLNRFWVHERKHPEHGIEIDLDLSDDPAFVLELEKARQESYFAGSRYDRRAQRRREQWEHLQGTWQQIQHERVAVREAGGSTPVLPWRRPQRPPRVRLKATCGRCQHAFELERDPLAETSLVCPKCELTEVLPSLRSDTLGRKEKVAVPAIAVDCPQCKTHFSTARNLHGPTQIRCPECGLEDQVPTPPLASAGS